MAAAMAVAAMAMAAAAMATAAGRGATAAMAVVMAAVATASEPTLVRPSRKELKGGRQQRKAWLLNSPRLTTQSQKFSPEELAAAT